MRDTHINLPEIIDAFEKDGDFFAIIELAREGRLQKFQFGISREGYSSLKHILQLRPFDKIPGVVYRYFFTSSYTKLDENKFSVAIRIEQGNTGKQLEAEMPKDLIATLKWFFELQNWQEAAHLFLSH